MFFSLHQAGFDFMEFVFKRGDVCFFGLNSSVICVCDLSLTIVC